jgi:hypothetical protein
VSAAHAIVTVLEQVAKHRDVIAAVIEAAESGVSRERLIASIKHTMTEASDEQMRREFGGR